jgi:transposase
LNEFESKIFGRSSPGKDFEIGSEEQRILACLESCDDKAARSRLKAVLLHIRGYSTDYVLRESSCSRSSLQNWCRLYHLHGPERLFDRRRGGNNAKLTDEQIQELAECLRDRTPRDFFGPKMAGPASQSWTVEDLNALLWRWYGVRYRSRTSYYDLLRKCAPGT